MSADAHRLPIHMDGARLWNASVASGVTLAALASYADTVMVAFSKGLGAPIGAALAGTREAMERAWTARKLFGGAMRQMRQSGILAAACRMRSIITSIASRTTTKTRESWHARSTAPAARLSFLPTRTS